MAKPLGIESLKIEPVVGEWYLSSGEQFEVVAVDEDDGTIEIQYFDSTLEELEFEHWRMQVKAGLLTACEPPDDYHGSYEIEDEGPLQRADDYDSRDGGLRASGLDSLDLFE
jgi:hypothetical protein